MKMETIIQTENLTKHFKDVVAVSEMSLHVRRGEIYGFLGLNGAGKTTTIRMLLGMIAPDKGKVTINGQKVSAQNSKLWEQVGFLVEVPYAYPNLTVRDNLEIIRKLRLINNHKAVDTVMEKVKLTSYANRKAKNLSLGNAQRLGIAKALIHNPDILILDEPANGLDPAGICEIRELLLDLSTNQGVTVFISSHILGEIARLATRIGIIHNGVLIKEINTNQLDKLCNKTLHLSTLDNTQAALILNDHGIKSIKTHNNHLVITQKEVIAQPELIATLLVNQQQPPVLLKVEEEDLETYFLRTIKETDLI